MKLKSLLFVLTLLFTSFTYADDTDIYLKSQASEAAPPFLMLMVDYRPSVFSSYCNGLRSCTGNFTKRAFIHLCVNTAPSNQAADCEAMWCVERKPLDLANCKELTP